MLFVFLLCTALVAQALAHPATKDFDDDDFDFDIDPEDIHFWLFRRGGNIKNPERVRLQDVSQLQIESNLELKVIIHGWTESITSFWYQPTIEAYFSVKNVNIIALDWNKHSLISYIQSVGAVRKVGQIIGDFLVRLNRYKGIPYDNMHIIGHSLGAHMAGFTGKAVQEAVGRKVGRVTGLDPAGPLWNLNTASRRLDASDADFVDVIHTDGLGLGIGREIGDIDFFPNGGTAIQSGCLYIVCSHNRAPKYFYESITRPESFIGRECSSNLAFATGLCRRNDVAVMGEYADPKSRGSFYLDTRAFSPYGRGENGA